MGVTVVSGGSGNGTSSSISKGDVETRDLFTTPNTANTMFIVDWSYGINFGSTTPWAPNQTGTDGPTLQIHGYKRRQGRKIVGPNTQVKIIISNPTNNSGIVADYEYSYVGITVT